MVRLSMCTALVVLRKITEWIKVIFFIPPPQKGKKQTKDYTSMKYKLYDIGF